MIYKKVLFYLLLICGTINSVAQDTVKIKETQIPVLVERKDNVLYYMRLNAKNSHILDYVIITLDRNVPINKIKSLKLYYSGIEARHREKENLFFPQKYISRDEYGKTLEANTSYSVLRSKIDPLSRKIKLLANQPLFPGINYFWISLEMKPNTSLRSKISGEISEVSLDGKAAPITTETKPIQHLMGIGVRHAGDDGASAYRIPGIVTSKNGTLLAVYDIRYNSSVDLQEYVNIGLSRSLNGGKTWEKMRIPLSFGEYGGLPKSQNGVGDPAILVDENTGTLWIVAAWTHGMGNNRAWWSSYPGMDLNHTAQLVLVKSDDDGKTWSAPINITSQVKDPSWYFLLQGPGRGITMSDGTLVFTSQYIDSTRVPNAGIIYSKDHGKSWKISSFARTNTTESQVIEVEPGVLMLNMRDNRGGSRAVAITKDMGVTWTEHPSSRRSLIEPVCMASIIKVAAKDNVLNKDILLFSNPNTVKGRNHITIKASFDGGITWLPQNQLLLDEDEAWGYSCLTMIDRETVGIVYESSVAHVTFQAIKLQDIINN